MTAFETACYFLAGTALLLAGIIIYIGYLYESHDERQRRLDNDLYERSAE